MMTAVCVNACISVRGAMGSKHTQEGTQKFSDSMAKAWSKIETAGAHRHEKENKKDGKTRNRKIVFPFIRFSSFLSRTETAF